MLDGLLPGHLLLENRREGVEGGPQEGLDDHDRREVGVVESLTQAREQAPGEAEVVSERVSVVHGRQQRRSHNANPSPSASRTR
jgi:hypothetical protein